MMARNDDSKVITITNLSKNFGTNTVLKDINITIDPGEFFTLLGASGCGKTTLLRCIAGFECFSNGKICFGKEDVSQIPPWKKNVGFVFQNYALWPHMTVFDNIAYGLRMRKQDSKYIRKMVAWGLETINLPDIEKRYPGELSGGQQQRVAIARALVFQPQVLLLDEPLSNLDAKMRLKMREEIRDLQRKLGITAIYVTHDQEEALEISDRIAVIDGGIVKQIGRPVEIYDMPANLFVANFVGKNNSVSGKIENHQFYGLGKHRIPLPELVQPDGDYVLSFRPEQVGINGTECHFKVKVSDLFYRGNIIQCKMIYQDEIELVAEVKNWLEVGSEIEITIDKHQFFKINNN
jgi:iron(III) transport system ATP-binding protein